MGNRLGTEMENILELSLGGGSRNKVALPPKLPHLPARPACAARAVSVAFLAPPITAPGIFGPARAEGMGSSAIPRGLCALIREAACPAAGPHAPRSVASRRGASKLFSGRPVSGV